jgi:hypothetical protein
MITKEVKVVKTTDDYPVIDGWVVSKNLTKEQK